jgi:putative thiamine transport system ATP-binding protein
MSLRIHIQQLRTPTALLVRDLQLQVPPGVVHTLMGPSGSGKSSVLAAVCGTLPAEVEFDGQVLLEGQRIDTLPTAARRVGILFQEDLLFAHMTVLENLLFAVPAGPRAQRLAQVQQALADVELQDWQHANPATLSGGQRSRAALARALLAQPQALLLDEPFSKLDTALRARMRSLLFGMVQARHIPALLVTHDAADVADPQHLTHLQGATNVA